MKSSLIQCVIAGGILVAALVGYWFWYSTIVAQSASVAQLESQIALKKATAARVSAARQELTKIAGDEANVQAYFVSEPDVVGFINGLQTTGKNLGTTVTVLSVAASQTATHPSLALSLTVKGSFDAVMRTLGAIEYAPYDLVVSSLAVTYDTKKTWQANATLLVGSESGLSPATPSATPSAPATSTSPSASTRVVPAGHITPKAP